MLPQEDEYVRLAAMHYSILFGPTYNRAHVQQVVEECITTQLIESRGMAKWMDLIRSEHAQVGSRFLTPTAAPGDLHSRCDDHAGSRQEEGKPKGRAGQQRPAEVALALLQVL